MLTRIAKISFASACNLRSTDRQPSSRRGVIPAKASIRRPLELHLPALNTVPHLISILTPRARVRQRMFQIAGADVLLLQPHDVCVATEHKDE